MPREVADTSRLARQLGHLAFVVPTLSIGWRAWRASRSLDGAEPGALLTLLVSLVLLAVLVTPRWRSAAKEISAALFTRASFLLWGPLALVASVVSYESTSAYAAAPPTFLLMISLASAAHLASRSRRQLAQKAAILVFYSVFFAGTDWIVGRYVIPRRSHNTILVVHDPLLGWKLRPDFSIERIDDEYTSLESTNSLGFRSPETPFEKPPGMRRILVLGDSHTEGYTVDDDQTWTRLLDAELGDSVEVVAMGVGGYSTDQELLAYLEYGRRFDPDLVLLQFCANDVAHNALDSYWRSRKPHFVAAGDLLQLRGVPVPDRRSSGLFGSELLQRSSIFLFIESRMRQLAVRKQSDEVDKDAAWEITELLIRDLKRAVENDGAALVCLGVGKKQPPQGHLGAILSRLGVPVLDLSSAYDGAYDRLWVSSHWNVEGQQRVAAALAPQLRAALDSVASGEQSVPIEASDRR